MPPSAIRRAGALSVAVLAAAALAWWEGRAIAHDLAQRRDMHRIAYARSTACAACHPQHYASWYRTFHRRMNAEAGPDTVLGAFDGRSLDWRGVRATMDRDGAGAFWMTFRDVASGRVLERDRVVRTVGSRRYQQYIARPGDVYLRLPVAWHVEEQRFFHMNSAFFSADPDDAAPVWPAVYGRYVARWNDNCVFCHNVAPNPGRDDRTGVFHTEVAELGVACEACHGPGAEHARANADPARRYALHLGHGADPTIVNPARLGPARSADLCGRCHGQRLADDVAPFLAHGDPFVPGDDLAMYTAPLWRDTQLAGRDGTFAPRFWADGTARLTAYEYQGLLQSPCAERGPMTCTSCHGMHEGDPHGQLRPAAVGDGACTSCHRAFGDARVVAQHTHHAAGEGAPHCGDCHMPRVVYGVLDIHPSHHIESPDPAREAANGRPDACTLCHVDQTRAWAVETRRRLWPGGVTDASHVATETLPEAARALFAGDPVERAVAADAIGRAPRAHSARDAAMRAGVLLEALEGDPYPAVRHLAWRALKRMLPDDAPAIDRFDPAAPRTTRANGVRAIAEQLGPRAVRPDAALVASLRAQSNERAIEVGE